MTLRKDINFKRFLTQDELDSIQAKSPKPMWKVYKHFSHNIANQNKRIREQVNAGKTVIPETHVQITAFAVMRLFNLMDFKCLYCGIDTHIFRDEHIVDGYEDTSKQNTMDHIQPINRGGLNVLENVLSCCKTCNNLKGDMGLFEWLEALNIEPDAFIARLQGYYEAFYQMRGIPAFDAINSYTGEVIE